MAIVLICWDQMIRLHIDLQMKSCVLIRLDCVSNAIGSITSGLIVLKHHQATSSSIWEENIITVRVCEHKLLHSHFWKMICKHHTHCETNI